MAVSVRASTVWTEVTLSSINKGLPAGIVSGEDRIFGIAVWKNQTVTGDTIAGWTKLIEFKDGTVNPGAGTGSVTIAVYYRDYDGSFSNWPMTWSANIGIGGVTTIALIKDAGDTWDTPEVVSAIWPASGAQTVTASSTVDISAGALVAAIFGVRDDSDPTSPTVSDIGSPAVGWNGVTVEEPVTALSTSTGNDIAADMAYRRVSTGATSVDLTAAWTLTASETGTLVWIVQDVTAGPSTTNLTPTPVVLDLAVPAPTLAPILDLAPAPVVLDLAVPAPTLGLIYTLSPAPVVLDLGVPDTTVSAGPGTITLTPSPVVLDLGVPAPAMATSLALTPAPVVIDLSVPAPALPTPLVIVPAPVALDLGVPAPTVQSGPSTIVFTPAPVVLDLSLGSPTLDANQPPPKYVPNGETVTGGNPVGDEPPLKVQF